MQIQRFAEGIQGLEGMFTPVKKKGYGEIDFGTDVNGDPDLMSCWNEEFTNRARWFNNIDVLWQATSGNAQLMALSGPRNPYPGKLGVIEEDAYADILLVNGNPLEDLTLFNKPEENLALMMKDGKLYKNELCCSESSYSCPSEFSRSKQLFNYLLKEIYHVFTN